MPKMMPGQEPYTAEELNDLSDLMDAAGAAEEFLPTGEERDAWEREQERRRAERETQNTAHVIAREIKTMFAAEVLARACADAAPTDLVHQARELLRARLGGDFDRFVLDEAAGILFDEYSQS